MACERVLERWSRELVLEALDCNTTESLVACGAWKSMSVCCEEAMLPYVMTSVPSPLFNVFMQPRLVEDNAVAYVETSIFLARQNGVPITWWLGALPTPESLGMILTAHGFVRAAPQWGMGVELVKADLDPELKLRIAEVTHAGQLEEFSTVMCPAQEIPEQIRGPWMEMFKSVGYGEGRPWRHFIGYVGDEAVATSSTYAGAGVVSVTHIAVAPDYRGWGFGREMMAWALRLARDEGYRIGVMWSTDAALHMCERVGFHRLCRGQVYVWTPDC